MSEDRIERHSSYSAGEQKARGKQASAVHQSVITLSLSAARRCGWSRYTRDASGERKSVNKRSSYGVLACIE